MRRAALRLLLLGLVMVAGALALGRLGVGPSDAGSSALAMNTLSGDTGAVELPCFTDGGCAAEVDASTVALAALPLALALVVAALVRSSTPAPIPVRADGHRSPLLRPPQRRSS